MKYVILLMITVALSFSAVADEKYKYCEIWGIAGGVDDSFTQNLVSRLLDRKALMDDQVCKSVISDSYRFGKSFGKDKNITREDMMRWSNYQNFRDKVMDSILDITGL